MNHIFLSKEQYNTLLSTGSVTVSGVTYNYDPDNNIYYTPSEHKVCHHFINVVSGDYRMRIYDLITTSENPINTPELLMQNVFIGLMAGYGDGSSGFALSQRYIGSISGTSIYLQDYTEQDGDSFPINTSTTVTDVVVVR